MAVKEDWYTPDSSNRSAPPGSTGSMSSTGVSTGLDIKGGVTSAVKAVKTVLEATVCPLVNSEAGKTATQVATSSPNPYGTGVQIVSNLCAPPVPIVSYPAGSVGVFDTSLGKFKIASPPTVGQDLFTQVGVEPALPAGVTQVSSNQYDKMTNYWYARKPFMIGIGVAAMSIVGFGSYLIVRQ